MYRILYQDSYVSHYLKIFLEIKRKIGPFLSESRIGMEIVDIFICVKIEL
jgi:hypothetical protein